MLSGLEKNFLYADPEAPPRYAARLLLLGLWSAATLYLALHHIVWRDEVRALTFALRGQNVFAMLGALHGEGHPALWYFLLRGAHTLFPVPQVLPAMAFAVGLAAAALLIFRSPFNLPVIALLLATGFFAYEYSVMARNYGISMVLMFAFAMVFDRHRDRGLVPGVILFLLVNCNIHSAFLAAGFLLFWLLEILARTGIAWSSELKIFIGNALLVALGAGLCFITVYPTFQDGAFIDHAGGISVLSIMNTFLVPAVQFREITGIGDGSALHPYFQPPHGGSLLNVLVLLMSLVLFAATLGLARRPSAMAAALAGLAALSCFFKEVYPGSYRHEALWLVFLVSLYWLAAPGDKATAKTVAWPAWFERQRPLLEGIGSWFLVVLLVLQLPVTASAVAGIGNESRSADLGKLFRAAPSLHDDTIIAAPDYLIDFVPYFASNPTYLTRERRYGATSIFNKKSILHLSLDDVLTKARQIHAATGRPVIILLGYKLDAARPAMTYGESYTRTFFISPPMARRFLAATRLVKSFPPTKSDENFDVYLLP